MGKSGFGKSTLFKLLNRLYNPLKGNIIHLELKGFPNHVEMI